MDNGVLVEVVAIHAEESASLWLLRDRAVHEPHYRLSDLSGLDDRIEAHLDGLRVAGDPGWEIARAALLEFGGAGEIFAAGVLAFEGGDEGRVSDALTVAAASPTAARGLVSALGWLPVEQASKYVKTLLATSVPAHRRVGIAASAIHRQRHDKPLIDALNDPDLALRARACRAAGELGLGNLHKMVRRSMASEDEACQFWAAWAAALLVGDRDGLAVLRKVAEGGGPFAKRAVQMAIRRMDPTTARGWRVMLGRDPKTVRLAILGAGAIGDPEVIPWLIDRMADPPLARVSGEAFSMITGAHIDDDKLDGEKPEGFEAGPTENPEDENVAMDPDENLPWPDPVAVRKWWEGRKGDFSNGTRYLVGKPMSPDWLGQVLRDGYQRQRAAAALELAIRQPGRPLFEVRAPGFRQQKLLGGAGAS
jgi:uncharacterized protein (TIGR02270 family)